MTLKHRIIFLFLPVILSLVAKAQDPLIDILQKELIREFSEYNKQEVPVYFLSYRVTERATAQLAATNGSIETNAQNFSRNLTVVVRVGSPEMDNYHALKNTQSPVAQTSWMAIENGEKEIRQLLWGTTNTAYFDAVQRFTRVKGTQSVNLPQEDKSPDYSTGPGVRYYEAPLKYPVDKAMAEKLADKLRLYSRSFSSGRNITNSSVILQVNYERTYFVSSEGSAITENLPKVNLTVYGTALAEDGMEMPFYKSYYAPDINGLPQDKAILSDIESLSGKLGELVKAPLIEPYAGPALMSGEVTGVFFHEIFGHRVEAARMKNDNDAQTFKNKVGQQVLNSHLSVIFDPTISEYRGLKLSGAYDYDDEGTNSQKVVVVNKGILSDFLTSRTPIANFPKSNGHGRAGVGMSPVSRQSNLIVESDKLYSETELRKVFLEEVKKQNLDFGIFFKTVTGGLTMTGRDMPNAFNITPIEVYKVYCDGRPDELIRGINLIGTPLAMFSEIEAAGGPWGVFNGNCGAESGSVPVASVCPMVFVKKIEIQKKSKSNITKPILDKPY